MPDDKTLQATWKKFGKPIPKSLSPQIIKNLMDDHLSALGSCFDQRVKAGDKELKGEINMKIRVAGDGTVLDVLLTTPKYKSTLFGDCIINAVKSKSFPLFESKEQVFTYYWNL